MTFNKTLADLFRKSDDQPEVLKQLDEALHLVCGAGPSHYCYPLPSFPGPPSADR